ncbi:hypothetical protein SLEP1_g28029 [Rubroshorea leprosula]|uniref:Uncharacterized protein n=1 Tax=Rubroshorea leprosula TaxID=152421 RepID=A0AAV5K207_9ROSI|nr:hypothetical protein SLEP1_g28029 [Rubroshorea leprosula]
MTLDYFEMVKPVLYKLHDMIVILDIWFYIFFRT